MTRFGKCFYQCELGGLLGSQSRRLMRVKCLLLRLRVSLIRWTDTSTARSTVSTLNLRPERLEDHYWYLRTGGSVRILDLFDTVFRSSWVLEGSNEGFSVIRTSLRVSGTHVLLLNPTGPVSRRIPLDTRTQGLSYSFQKALQWILSSFLQSVRLGLYLVRI